MTRKLRDACWGHAALSLQGLTLFSALLALPSATLRAVSGTVEPGREAQPPTQSKNALRLLCCSGGVIWLLLICFCLKFVP